LGLVFVQGLPASISTISNVSNTKIFIMFYLYNSEDPITIINGNDNDNAIKTMNKGKSAVNHESGNVFVNFYNLLL
jgi:hypothetical protein